MDADLALLQEVTITTWGELKRMGDPIQVADHEPWLPWKEGNYPCWPLIVKLSDRVQVDWLVNWVPGGWPGNHQFPASGIGIAAAARVTLMSGASPFAAVSMYARWVQSHRGVRGGNRTYADASAHLIISDISTLVTSDDSAELRIVVAGDLNVTFNAVSNDNPRSQAVLDRFRALGFEYLGPQHPDGRRSSEQTQNVVTLRRPGKGPDSAYTQADHVFATAGYGHGH